MIYARYFKRAVDIAGSVLLIMTFSWLMFLITIIYILSLNFPIIFLQKRIGKNDMPFTVLKFRTLSIQTKVPVVERRFLLGDFLRATSLDELPQLFNVLKGDMSFIGPRPLPVEYLPFYSVEQRSRHNVRPGITGWAQVNGRNSISWAKKFELDKFYIKNISVSLDLRILIKTTQLMLAFRKDISLNEKPFHGN